MKLKLIDDIEVDLEDDLYLYFFHEYIQWKIYSFNRASKSDIRNKINLSEFHKVFLERANTGGWDFAKENVIKFDNVLWKSPNKCNTMCISNKDENHDTLIICLASLAGHGFRLKHSFSQTSNDIYNTSADILNVTEDPLRFPEGVYPSNFILGCSDRLNSVELMCEEIRNMIVSNGKNYKHIVVYSDSKHAGAGITVAIRLKDIVTNCFIIHGTLTHDFNQSPIVKEYFDNLGKEWYISPTQWMHIIKSYQYTFRHNVPDYVLNPLDNITDCDFKIDYFYGKYDDEYKPFLDYGMSKNKNINFIEVDYRTRHETHFIRPYVDKHILKRYINEI